MRQVGERVGAIVSAIPDTVTMFGYGVYVGDEIPPPGIMGPFGEMHEFGLTNPKIVLDNGEVVWGCECWWGPEEKIRNMVGDRPVVTLSGTEYRKRRGKTS